LLVYPTTVDGSDSNLTGHNSAKSHFAIGCRGFSIEWSKESTKFLFKVDHVPL